MKRNEYKVKIMSAQGEETYRIICADKDIEDRVRAILEDDKDSELIQIKKVS